MRKTTKLFTSLAMTLALGASLAACSSPEENSSAACDSYAKLVGSVAEVKTSLTSASSVNDIQAAHEKVKTSYADLQKSLDKVSGDRKEAFDAAWKDFDKAVSDVDKNLTVPQAKEALADDVAKIQAAQTELNKDLTC
ncbi:hypothetical protein ACFY5D_10545 [Paeniglutamicibacter sp. NPDC012692]|uniref:hypothetical protein n=1 Tax=Paeniglutamicibacter sp. NPDC012692 TaxID=3364388 RepID=UPI0036830561